MPSPYKYKRPHPFLLSFRSRSNGNMAWKHSLQLNGMIDTLVPQPYASSSDIYFIPSTKAYRYTVGVTEHVEPVSGLTLNNIEDLIDRTNILARGSIGDAESCRFFDCVVVFPQLFTRCTVIALLETDDRAGGGAGYWFAVRSTKDQANVLRRRGREIGFFELPEHGELKEDYKAFEERKKPYVEARKAYYKEKRTLGVEQRNALKDRNALATKEDALLKRFDALQQWR
ncbi:hypothetical protein LTS18_013983, partial [Coniosporium uncinatum]